MSVFITGVGKTKFGVSSKSLAQLAYEALQKALADSKMPVRDLDAIYVSNFVGGPLQSQLHMNSVVSSLLPELRIPIIRVETACAAGGSALYQAIISLSRFKNVMVLGVEKMTDKNTKESTKTIAMAGERQLDQMEGLLFPASYALVAQQHMLKYGTTMDDLARVSFKNHNNANLNPLAHFYHKKVSLETIKRSPIVASPLRLFDCSPISDGSAALIVSKERKSDRDVEVIASELATDYISIAERNDFTSFQAARIAARNAFKKARLSPGDIDVAEVHDCFTIAELIAMEDIGFCKPGESKNLIRKGRTEINGDIPINVDGGLKAGGHPIGVTGVSQVCEITTQIRGEAGKRQVDGAKVGLTHNIGGVGGTAVVHILRGGKNDTCV